MNISGLSDLLGNTLGGGTEINIGAEDRGPVRSKIRPPPPQVVTAAVTRGVCRWLGDMGFSTLIEFKLGNCRRADVVGLNEAGTILMVEVKSTPEDFRGDAKWLEYVPYCDAFSFAVPPHFPWQILPENVGVVMADAHTAAIMRPAPQHSLHASRRKALTLRFALSAGQRLASVVDPRV